METLIVEDDHALGKMLQRMLNAQDHTCTLQTTVADAHQSLAQHQYDLLVLDWNLPDGSGVSLLQDVRRVDEQTPILMLTARGSVDDKVTALTLGADDYIVKPFERDELVARVHAVLRRVERIPALAYRDFRLDPEELLAWRGNREIILSNIEWQICRMLLANSETVCESTAIYDDVWGYRFAAGTNTLHVHMASLRGKLEHHGESRLIHNIRGFGYMLKEER